MASRAIRPWASVRAASILNPSKRRPFTWSSTLRNSSKDKTEPLDIDELLSKPTWSVSSLMPAKENQPDSPAISSIQLHHLLRLSALPPPKDEAEEAKMLNTLSSQLHFVREIQTVDTTGVSPLQSLRDETVSGERDAELGMDALKDALDLEEIRGKHHKRIRRGNSGANSDAEPSWDVLGTAGKKMGRYFVVEGGKEKA